VLWSQATDWPGFLAAAQRAENLGFDSVWTWDHLLAIFGDPDQPILEGYVALGALAQATSRVELGLLVGANTFRNPGIATKSVLTLDQVSGGRAILGIGGAWFGREHEAFGLDFGTGHGQRLDWLAEAVAAMRTWVDGGRVTSAPGGRYAFRDLGMLPRAVRPHLPIMIGGSGVKKTLPIVAQHADQWNAFGEPHELAAKDAILRARCADVGRDPEMIERTVGCKITIRRTDSAAREAIRGLLAHNGTSPDLPATDRTFWTGTPEAIAERMLAYVAVGFRTFLVELPAPYDAETMELLTGVVKPMVEAAAGQDARSSTAPT
jgi:alkanesulfonate monooxygenase SsuD/methylene tetrahydromethanopterin reductase-like flavin-dependent oxidoreductase (luciferase family)